MYQRQHPSRRGGGGNNPGARASSEPLIRPSLLTAADVLTLLPLRAPGHSSGHLSGAHVAGVLGRSSHPRGNPLVTAPGGFPLAAPASFNHSNPLRMCQCRAGSGLPASPQHAGCAYWPRAHMHCASASRNVEVKVRTGNEQSRSAASLWVPRRQPFRSRGTRNAGGRALRAPEAVPPT